MRIIYIKMLSSHLMDLMKCNQAPDFTFDIENGSYKMFQHMNNMFRSHSFTPFCMFILPAIGKPLGMILPVYF